MFVCLSLWLLAVTCQGLCDATTLTPRPVTLQWLSTRLVGWGASEGMRFRIFCGALVSYAASCMHSPHGVLRLRPNSYLLGRAKLACDRPVFLNFSKGEKSNVRAVLPCRPLTHLNWVW